MTQMVIVVGTNHSLQLANLELKSVLEGLCHVFNVRAIGEEMSEEALAEKSCAASIPMQIAAAFQLAHRLCDPNTAERATLGIRQEGQIRMAVWPSRYPLPEPEVIRLLKESYEIRERYWLEQLRSLNVWPVLFICGSDHVTSFCRLLKQQSIQTHVAAEDWLSTCQ